MGSVTVTVKLLFSVSSDPDAISYMLAAKVHCIAAAKTRIEQDFKRTRCRMAIGQRRS